MKLRISSLALVIAAAFFSQSLHADSTAVTDPVGFVTANIAAGLGSAKKSTLFSVPLLETEGITGQISGVITGVGSNTISNSSAGWGSGELAQAETPFLVMVTSGAAEGRMFLISANTTNTLTVSSVDSVQTPDLTTLGIVPNTDTYTVVACGTLKTLFGTPETTGIQGGTTQNNADTIVMVVNGTASTYFYKTDAVPPRWTRVDFGSPNASNTPVLPYYGIDYRRLPATPLSFVVTGAVPTKQRKVGIKNSGTTLLSQYWPTESTLAGLGIHNISGWVSAPLAANADTVILTANGIPTTYWYDGTNWRKVDFGSPISNNIPIQIGTTVQVNKKGNASGYATLTQPVPYSLN